MSVQHHSIWFSHFSMCNVQTFDNRTKLSSAGCWYTDSTTVLYICRNADVLATAGVKCGPKTPPRCGCWITVPSNLMHWLSSPHMNTCSNKNTMQWAISTHGNASPVHATISWILVQSGVFNLLHYGISHTISWQNVNTVTRLWTGWSKVWSLAEARDLSLFQTAQNGSGAQLASIQWTLQALSLRRV